MQCPWYTSVDTLRADGFSGFVTIRDLRRCKLDCVPSRRGDIGVYIVLRPEADLPVFLERSTGGRFKDRDPNVPQEILTKHRVPGAQIVYIGKAGIPGKSATLRSRIGQYLDFGAGRPIGHWGGRFIWHLPSSEELVVCWKPTPEQIPRDVEQRMIQEFKKAFGVRPFANLRD